MVTGPANHLKDDMVPIEALVETDWLPNSFTMNWKITVPEKLITFEKKCVYMFSTWILG